MSEVIAIPTGLSDSNEQGLKEKMTELVPRYVAEVARYDDTLEDLPTR